jgi:hypothetical protein
MQRAATIAISWTTRERDRVRGDTGAGSALE